MKLKDLTKDMMNKKIELEKTTISVDEKVANNGSKYLSVKINDGSDVAYSNIFNDKKSEKLYNLVLSLENDKNYKINGKVRAIKEGTNGFNKIDIDKIEAIETVKKLPTAKENAKRLSEIIKTIEDSRYKDLIKKVFDGKIKKEDGTEIPEIDKKLFFAMPMSENHYVYEGGLVDHIIRVYELIDSYLKTVEGLNYNRDLIVTAIVLYRIGKTKTLMWNRKKATLTTQGVLSEDVTVSHDIVNKYLQESSLTEDEKLQLLHMIDASKYKPEYGAIAAPKTKEAFLLYYFEMISLTEETFKKIKENAFSEENQIILGSGYRTYYTTEKINSPKEKEDE